MENIVKQLISYSHRIAEKELVLAASGNISARAGGSMLIKASGCFMEQASAADFVKVDIKSLKYVSAGPKPSCEFRMHAVCYQARPEINCVIHTHPLYATTLSSCSIKPRLLSPEFILSLGSGLEVIDYICPGTESLAKTVGKAVQKANIIYLKNHGLLTVGEDLKQAYTRTILAEQMAKMQIIAQLLGKKLPGITAGQAKKLLDHLQGK